MSQREPSGWAVGAIMFAGVIMIMVGIFQAFAGLGALLKSGNLLVATPNYFVTISPTSWGWIHLILGTVIFLAGFGVIAGQTWARVVGIILAVVSAIANFAFIPKYPVWALLIIALDVWIIWALAAHGRDVQQV